MHEILPHGRPEQFAPALWEVSGTLSFPLARHDGAPLHAHAGRPAMKVVTTRSIAAKMAGKLKVHSSPEEVLPALGVHPHQVPGMKYDEVVLDVPTGDADGGRALLFTDVVGCGKPKGLLMRMLGPPGGRGVPRIVKSDASAFLRQAADGL